MKGWRGKVCEGNSGVRREGSWVRRDEEGRFMGEEGR